MLIPYTLPNPVFHKSQKHKRIPQEVAMATIKDVAKAAGVSATTVSLIINGKAKERRIADETSARVFAVMNELGYRPNMSARRLRSDEQVRPTVAFYWPSDYRSNYLGSFMMHFQETLEEIGFDCDIVIQSYVNDQLENSAEPLRKNNFNGAIIGATSKKDVEFLEQLDTRTPIVLLSRQSERFSTVSSDNDGIGHLAARLFRTKGYTEAAVFTSLRPYVATGARTQSFLAACAELGINVDASWIFRGENSIEGGVQASEAYCRLKGAPSVIFCDSDSMALGAMYTFHKRGIRLPDDVEFIAIQLLEKSFTKYAIPPITTIAMPTQKMAKCALDVIRKLILNPLTEPVHELIEPNLDIRETFQ